MVFFLGKAPYSAELRRPMKNVLGVITATTLIAVIAFGTIVYINITTSKEQAKVRSIK